MFIYCLHSFLSIACILFYLLPAGRTVISPDPNLRVDQVGVPVLVAKTMTYPERVNRYNLEKLQMCIENGPDKHPGANMVRWGLYATVTHLYEYPVTYHCYTTHEHIPAIHICTYYSRFLTPMPTVSPHSPHHHHSYPYPYSILPSHTPHPC